LPTNLYLIGTMNTADRSIALVDSAMRRRFAFVPLDPSVEPTRSTLAKWLKKNKMPMVAASLLEELNRRIGDPDFQVGPSYFMKSEDHSRSKLERVWRTSIVPLLEEHFFGRWEDEQKRFAFDALWKIANAKAADALLVESESLVGVDEEIGGGADPDEDTDELADEQ
jgi:5-methylcytosine-specific restriction enzyme B